jgi:membrane-bound lytic murein transglycosylase B
MTHLLDVLRAVTPGARRPHRPLHAFDDDELAGPAPSDGGPDGGRMSGLRAWLRRGPRLTRSAALGCVAAGIALFVVLSLSSPLTTAGAHHRSGPLAAGHPQGAAVAAEAARQPATLSLHGLIALARAGDTALAPRLMLGIRPVHAATPAPAGRAVVAALAANGIPNVALNAYRVAAARVDHAGPGCGLGWPLLAAIGRVESDNGRYGGAVFNADGTTTPKIIGPALDGVHYDYIPAPSDGLALDGDATYAHALGPMQFIPQTWSAYGADADGDGVASVFDINDAALGAARYLCAAGGDLRTAAGRRAAVLAYNHSDQYVAQVLALANAYRRGIPVTGIPVGDTTAALPPARTNDVPPANPGAPTAAKSPAPATGRSGARHHQSRPTTRATSTAPSTPSASSTAAAPTPAAGSTTPAPGRSAPPPKNTLPQPSPSPVPPPSPARRGRRARRRSSRAGAP